MCIRDSSDSMAFHPFVLTLGFFLYIVDLQRVFCAPREGEGISLVLIDSNNPVTIVASYEQQKATIKRYGGLIKYLGLQSEPITGEPPKGKLIVQTWKTEAGYNDYRQSEDYAQQKEIRSNGTSSLTEAYFKVENKGFFSFRPLRRGIELVIFNIHIKQTVGFSRWRQSVLSLIRMYKGYILFTGEVGKVIEGNWAGNYVMLVSFSKKGNYESLFGSEHYKFITKNSKDFADLQIYAYAAQITTL
eukprot:TRINITY_DN550_c0_g2_i3.p1 TRINITY_DN550_c0_g2~~TRINITY_DN550_c0_g2_i3.p1  ORF type:complete len:265 (+),score=53.43 TRINITY_DN550_c0_g2_i3:63-797(+)